MRASNRILLAVILLIAYACNQKKLDPSIINVPGDFKNIQSAIDFAEPGKTIKIKNGIYEEKIVFKDGVSIIGETAEGVIICNLVIKGHVISVKDCPTGLISNITVAQDDGDESEIDNIRSDTGGIRIENSDIQVKRCFFRNCLGPGIYITGASKPTISDCTFTENGFLGLLSSGPDAAPVITGNFFMKNIYGICFNEGSKGIAEKNYVTENKCYGITSTDPKTAPIIRNNKSYRNGHYGVVFMLYTGGVAEQNLCEDQDAGIFCFDKGNPQLINNTCIRNNIGILVSEEGKGTVTKNICKNNRTAGIQVQRKGESIIEKNDCRNNASYGIDIIDEASATIIGNDCYFNGKNGILILRPKAFWQYPEKPV